MQKNLFFPKTVHGILTSAKTNLNYLASSPYTVQILNSSSLHEIKKRQKVEMFKNSKKKKNPKQINNYCYC